MPPTLALRLVPWFFVFLWSTGFIVARYGMPHASPFLFLCARFLLSGALLAGWALVAKQGWPRSARDWGTLALVGILMQAGYLGGVWAAVKWGMGAGLVALIVSFQAVLTLLLMPRPPGVRREVLWMGAMISTAGVALVLWPRLQAAWHGLDARSGGVAMWAAALVALLGITLGTILQKRRASQWDFRVTGAVQQAGALIVMVPLACLEPRQWDGAPALWASLCWSVLALTIGASSLLYFLIQRQAAVSVGSTMHWVPSCTVAMAFVLFGEPAGWELLLGTALAAWGISRVQRAVARAAHANEATQAT